MLKLKNISGALLLMLLVGTTHVFGQNPNTNDTLRYIDKIPHWLSVYQLTAPDYLRAQRKQFKSNAYVETYIEAVLDNPVWMFTMLNQFAALRNTAARNTPHIVFNIRYKPLNDQLTNYQVLLTVTGSAQIPLNFNAITQSANFLGLNGRTFPTPQDASDEVAQAIQEAMRLISREVGSSLSPNLMVKYKNEVFWNGHEILINKEGDNQITLQPLGKFGVPLSPEQVSWTNASNGVVDMTGLQNKSITLTRLDTAASLTVNIKRRSSFVLDTKTLLRPIVLQVLEERLAAVLDELVNTRVDSINNANSVASLVAQLEAGNIPLEGNEALVPLFAQPLVLTDSTGFKRSDTGIKARTLRELRKAKAIRQLLRTKVNTRVFCNLLIQQPDKLDELMDELLLNSGQLLGELVLNLGNPSMLQSARNIIITYLNENMTRLAGSNFGMANDEPITVTYVQSATSALVFDPATRLYIANNVDFPGKEAFKNEMTAYLNALDTPLYVFVNYSQDVSTETYLKRTIGTRPAGLPPDAKYATFTIVNMPGSIQEQLLVSGSIQAPVNVVGKTSKQVIVDLLHDPNMIHNWLHDDEESAMTKPLLTSKYVFMHDQLSTKSYVSNTGTNEFTQEAIDYVDSRLYQLDTAGIKTYVYFAYIWFHPGNIDRFDQLIDNSFSHAIDSIKQNLNVKDFNLLAIVNAKYDTALASGLKTVSFREQFYPMSGLSAECTKSVSDYLKSTSKKTFVNGLDGALKERADILHQKLKNCEVVVPEEIVIHYKRKGRNKYRTWGEFTIVGTDYKGYILERDKGPNPSTRETCKRHPSGTYELTYKDLSNGSSKYAGVTLCLAYDPDYILHGGNRADQSMGCLLVNKNSPKDDKYPEVFQSKIEDICNSDENPREENTERNKYSIANTYYDHKSPNNPAKILTEFVRNMEAEIKSRYKVETVVKKIIIDDSKESIEND